jgi:non-ribosomal peptide synthetase component F
MVAHRNVTHFVDAMVERYGITEHDRFSQTFDLTFDLSAFDMFVCWERGGCLCAPTQSQKMLPGKYVNDCRLTVWFSVPSTAVLMSRLRILKPGKFPGLRWSLFCGEALPVEVIQRFAEAAPNSVCENLYGPTELTIACTLYRWDTQRSAAESELGVVPIGEPYPGMKVLVADEQQREVAEGEAGELLMTGPQLTLGYFNDPARTAAAFVVPPGRTRGVYRTGDRVRRPPPGKPLVYLGRVDNQIKIQGYRVELGEIEAVLRDEAGVEVAIAVGWPVTPSGADGVVGFLGADRADTAAIRNRVIARLPPYMHPSALHLVPSGR